MKGTKPGITRRNLGLTIVASAAGALAQQPPTEDLAGAARERLKQNIATLRKFQIPLATEPSFTFRA